MPKHVAAHARSPIASIIAAYAAMASIWGTTWIGIKFALLGLPPVASAGVRFVLAGVLMYGVALGMRVDLRRNAPPLRVVLILAATLFGFNYALTYYAETHLASGLVAVLFGAQPFFTFGLAAFMLRERTGPLVLAGAIAAFAGVTLISLGGDLQADARYVGAALLAALLSGYAQVYLKRHSGNEPLATLPPAMLLAGAAMTAFGAAFEHPHWAQALAPVPLAATLYLAVFGSAVAFYLNHWLLQRIPSGTVGMSSLLIPVIALVAGAALGAEQFSSRQICGSLLVLAGMWLALQRKSGRGVAELEAVA
jgi:drug/metabolite transporter (DMT)-like permease